MTNIDRLYADNMNFLPDAVLIKPSAVETAQKPQHQHARLVHGAHGQVRKQDGGKRGANVRRVGIDPSMLNSTRAFISADSIVSV